MFRFIGQLRLASLVLQVVALIFQNLTLGIIGLAVLMISYQLSIHRLEALFEALVKAQDEEK